MTPSERARRIEAATAGLVNGGFGQCDPARWRWMATTALNAADEAVPVVSETEMQRRSRIDHEAAERVRKLCDYVRETAGDESCIVLVASLNTIRERTERAEKERDDWKGVYENYRDDAEESIARAEAAARDFAQALVEARTMIIREFGKHDPWTPWDFIDEAFALHPSFSGVEGTE